MRNRLAVVNPVLVCTNCSAELLVGPVFQFSGAFACGSCVLDYMLKSSPFPERVRLEEWGRAFTLEQAADTLRLWRGRRRHVEHDNESEDEF